MAPACKGEGVKRKIASMPQANLQHLACFGTVRLVIGFTSGPGFFMPIS
jgi:hypothetical protein